MAWMGNNVQKKKYADSLSHPKLDVPRSFALWIAIIEYLLNNKNEIFTLAFAAFPKI
jgi:hypothetical protein